MSSTKKTLVPPLKKREGGDDSSGTESKGTGTTPRSARKTSDAPPTKNSGNNNVNSEKEEGKSNTARNARTARGKNRRRRRAANKALGQNDSTISALINSSEAQGELAPAIKAVFEQNKEHLAIEKLQQFTEQREQEIEKICQNNYQAFIKSLDELFVVKDEVHQLKQSTIQVNKDIQTIGKDLIHKTEELVSNRTISKNINTALEVLSSCQYVLGLVAKVKLYVEQKRFYPAIKILDQLQQVHLESIRQYEFGKFLEKRIPLIKESIKKRVIKEVNEWLTGIRSKSLAIGTYAMAQTLLEMEIEEEQMALRQKQATELAKMATADLKTKQALIAQLAATTPKVISRRSRRISKFQLFNTRPFLNLDFDAENGTANGENNEGGQNSIRAIIMGGADNDYIGSKNEGDILSINVFEKFAVSFAPLYQCSYIYESMGIKEEFSLYYKENRKAQARLMLAQPKKDDGAQSPRGTTGFLATGRYQELLNHIAGFFIIEDTVFKTANNLIVNQDVVALWENAISKVRSHLQLEVAYCDEPALLAELKTYLLIFARTLRSYGRDTTSIMEFARVVLRERFFQVLSAIITQLGLNVLKEEKWIPLIVADEYEYKQLIADNRLDTLDPAGSSEIQRRTFPFTSSVPIFCNRIKNAVSDMNDFGKDFAGPEMNSAIIKATEGMMANLMQLMVQEVVERQKQQQALEAQRAAWWAVKLSKDKNNKLYFAPAPPEDDKITLDFIVQVIINVINFQHCIVPLEETLTGLGITIIERVLTHCKAANSAALTNMKTYEESIERLRHILWDVNESCMKKVFEQQESKMNWMTTTPVTQPREYILNIEKYILDNFAKFSNLPQSIFIELYRRTFKFIADRFMGWLTRNSVTHYTLETLKGLQIELNHFLATAMVSPVTNPTEYFTELMQLLHYITQPHPKVFLEREVRAKDYPRLTDVHLMVTVLEKCKDDAWFVSARSKEFSAVVRYLKEHGIN